MKGREYSLILNAEQKLGQENTEQEISVAYHLPTYNHFVDFCRKMEQDRNKEEVMNTEVHKEVDEWLERLRRWGSVPSTTHTNISQNWIFFTSSNIFSFFFDIF